MKPLILFFILIILILVSYSFFESVDAEHIRSHNEYTFHITNHYEFATIHEIFIMEIYVQTPFHPKCADGYGMNQLGECTDIAYHYDVYPLRLVSEMPKACPVKALGCVLDTGIYIKNGMQGMHTMQGCTVLWHEIRHIQLHEYDPEEEHRIMAQEDNC